MFVFLVQKYHLGLPFATSASAAGYTSLHFHGGCAVVTLTFVSLILGVGVSSHLNALTLDYRTPFGCDIDAFPVVLLGAFNAPLCVCTSGIVAEAAG